MCLRSWFDPVQMQTLMRQRARKFLILSLCKHLVTEAWLHFNCGQKKKLPEGTGTRGEQKGARGRWVCLLLVESESGDGTWKQREVTALPSRLAAGGTQQSRPPRGATVFTGTAVQLCNSGSLLLARRFPVETVSVNSINQALCWGSASNICMWIDLLTWLVNSAWLHLHAVAPQTGWPVTDV